MLGAIANHYGDPANYSGLRVVTPAPNAEAQMTSGANQTSDGARAAWIDIAKGIAICLVVLGHTIRGLQNSPSIAAPDIWRIVDAAIYSFHMPLFFALSGWFYLAMIRRRSFGAFALGRLERILWPMVLWGYLFLIALYLAGDQANAALDETGARWLPIPGILHLWFLWDLLILSFVFYPLRFVQDPSGTISWRVCVVVAAIVLAIQAVPTLFAEPDWLDTAIRNAPFFLIGVCLGSRSLSAPNGTLRVVAACAFVACLLVWPSLDARGLELVVSAVLVLCALCLLWRVDRVTPVWVSRGLQVIGMASLTIYVAHTILSAALRQSLIALGLVEPWMHLVFGTAAGIVLPLNLLQILRRLRATRLFGLEVSVPVTGLAAAASR